MALPVPPIPSTDSQKLQKVYSCGYFHGENSGYPSSGYGTNHPDWEPWLEFFRLLKPNGTLVDLGCAYGFLIESARRFGYTSFGLDISRYALAQHEPIRAYLVQGHLQQLPLRSRSTDLVTLFDVLEHLPDPIQCLQEASRILKPEGVMVGATPDPLYFHREEQTHCFERPPSFWLEVLNHLGFQVRFRFSEEPYNYQFVAAAKDSTISTSLTLFAHDHFSDAPDFLTSGEPLIAVPRQGWAPLARGRRLLQQSPASVYLLNPGRDPFRLSLSCKVHSTSHFGRLRVRLNSLILKQLYLSSERDLQSIRLPRVLLPSGGHHLFFELLPQDVEVEVSELKIQAESVAPSELALGLPFDLYQRYRLSGQLTSALRPDSVLDVGGHLGDLGGHLATSQDFFCAEDGTSVQSTDLRHCDHPGHSPAAAWDQPFADQSFDLVASLDVLEHLPPGRRYDFLRELDRLSRQWIVLGAPFSSLQVQEIEQDLQKTVLQESNFLKEHRELGLPETEMVEQFFAQEREYEVLCFPNGYLPRWKAMQVLTQHYFGLHDYTAIDTLNRLYNSLCYPMDQTEPAYRNIFLVCKTPLDSDTRKNLQRLLSNPPHELGLLERLAENPSFLELHGHLKNIGEEETQALHAANFLSNERQKWIQLLQQDLEEVQEELRSLPLWKLALRRFRARRANSHRQSNHKRHP